MQSKALPGFRDLYPDDASLRNDIFHAWRSVATRYGFEEYDGPPLEPLELYTQKSGPEIVEQLYHFVDKGGREVALRPEMTPTLARMVAAHAQGLKKPLRWFSMPQLFRYERQQRGRLREHFQLNMDLIGEAGPLADAEIIAAAIDVVRALGLGQDDFLVRVSDRRVIRTLLARAGVTDDQLGHAMGAIDKIERVPGDVLAEQLQALGVSNDVVWQILAIGGIRGPDARSRIDQALGPDRDVAEHLWACVDALASMGLGGFVEIDCAIVRGLAYYTGVVFELFDRGRDLRAICGGGRYDGLLKSLGGPDLPGVGFGMGDVVLGELVKARRTDRAAPPTVDAFLVPVTAADFPAVLALAHDLRERGVRVEFALREQAIGKQLKLAAARRARRAVVIGPEERMKGEVVMRNLESGTEERVALGALVAYAWT